MASTQSRYAHRVSFSFLVYMVFFAVLLATGGVTYSIFKHKQVTVRTEIDKIHREIAVHKMNANQYRAKANAQTNYWGIISRLKMDESQLQNIELNQIEMARTLNGESAQRATVSR